MKDIKPTEKVLTEEPKLTAVSFMESSISIYADEEPIAIRILRAGWTKPQMYHVLIEFGDMETTDYKGMFTAEQIKEKYGMDLEKEDLGINQIEKSLPNDQELGKAIRKIVKKYGTKTEI